MASFVDIALATLSHDSTLVNVERGIFFGTVLLLVLTLVYKTQCGVRNDPLTTDKIDVNEMKQRKWGEWAPTSFSYPWGAYHVTMGIRDMPWDDWIELDKQMVSYYYIKKHRIATRGASAIQILPDKPGMVKSASPSQATIEVVHELAEYLSKRYPDAFTVCRSAWGHISSITIVPVNDTFDLPPPLVTKDSLKLRQVSMKEAEHALKVSALLVQDDMTLMMEGTDGQYYLQGGAVCVPGFWRMGDKLGMSMAEIHIQGHVAQYETKLRTSIDRHFKRMTVEKPIVRNNYAFQVIPPKDVRRPVDITSQSAVEPVLENDSIVDPEELAWSVTTNGVEETFVHGQRYAQATKSPVVAAENLRLRTERQALRRLPLSGAILFTFRTYQFPMEDLAKEPGIPARMASAIRSWPEDVVKYKGYGLYGKVLLEYLDKAAEEQWVAGGEKLEKELVKGYPY